MLTCVVCSDDGVASYPAPDEPHVADDLIVSRAEPVSSVSTEPHQPDDGTELSSTYSDADVHPVGSTELASTDVSDNVSSYADASEPDDADTQTVSHAEPVSDDVAASVSVSSEPCQPDDTNIQATTISTEYTAPDVADDADTKTVSHAERVSDDVAASVSVSSEPCQPDDVDVQATISTEYTAPDVPDDADTQTVSHAEPVSDDVAASVSVSSEPCQPDDTNIQATTISTEYTAPDVPDDADTQTAVSCAEPVSDVIAELNKPDDAAVQAVCGAEPVSTDEADDVPEQPPYADDVADDHRPVCSTTDDVSTYAAADETQHVDDLTDAELSVVAVNDASREPADAEATLANGDDEDKMTVSHAEPMSDDTHNAEAVCGATSSANEGSDTTGDEKLVKDEDASREEGLASSTSEDVC